MSKSSAWLEGEARPLITDSSLSLLGERERQALLRVFDDCARRGGREGDEVAQFEKAFAAKLGSKHAIALASGTSGLQIALEACGVKLGDEVLVSPYTFAASIHAILHAGATPVFVDIELETLCISPESIRSRLSPRTRAVVAVHIGGKSARMNEILQIAADHGLFVIEDAAQAHGSTLDGRYLGAFGTAGVFSFSPKLMTSFRGGAVVTNDDELAERCRRLRFHGLPSRSRVRTQQQLDVAVEDHFVHHDPGYSLAMTPLQAAILMPQIESLDERFCLRHDNAMYLARIIHKNTVALVQMVVSP